MLRLNQPQRSALSETLRELANLAVGALVLGQFVGNEPSTWWLTFAGMLLWLIIVAWALVLEKGADNG